MDIRDHLRAGLREALEACGVAPPAQLVVERPASPDHGDWSSNAALVTAKQAGRSPRELAAELAERISARPPAHVAAIEVAGPGFLNFRLHNGWLHDVLRTLLEDGAAYARHDHGAGTTVNVEFVSANPNKPLHAGHGRGACYGDAVARLRERCGFEVTREYYVNDRGVQMQRFAESLAARKRGETPPDDGYLGDYLIGWAAEMPDGADPLEWGLQRALASHKATLARLGIGFDVWFSERSMVASGAIGDTLAELRAREAVFEADGATWLRSTACGDDKDRVLVKTDGDLTYLAPDIAYHRDKFSRAQRLFNVWGADHHGYVPRMKAAMALLGHDPDELEISVMQLVDLVRDGREVKMAGRTGDLVELDKIIDEVGADAARFTFLSQSVDTRQSFDLDKVSTQDMDNPVYYVQYAHARICSILARAAEAGIEPASQPASTDFSLLVHQRELDLLRSLHELPDVVRVANDDNAPHRVATWVREQAAALHGFYHECYVIGEGVSPELTAARLALVRASQTGLRIALGLLGVSAPEAM